MHYSTVAVEKHQISCAKQASLLFLAFTFALLCSPIVAHAADTPMGYVLCTVVGFFTGNLGRGLATLAVIIVGVGATLGKVSWGLAITVAIGIAVVFNAPTIVNKLGAGEDGCVLGGG